MLHIYLLVAFGSAGLLANRCVCKTKWNFHLAIDVCQAQGLQPLEIKKVETLTTPLRLSETRNLLLCKTKKDVSDFFFLHQVQKQSPAIVIYDLKLSFQVLTYCNSDAQSEQFKRNM